MTQTAFQRGLDTYLPNYVFAYYSGWSSRLERHFDRPTRKHYERILKSPDRELPLRRLFFCRKGVQPARLAGVLSGRVRHGSRSLAGLPRNRVLRVGPLRPQDALVARQRCTQQDPGSRGRPPLLVCPRRLQGLPRSALEPGPGSNPQHRGHRAGRAPAGREHRAALSVYQERGRVGGASGARRGDRRPCSATWRVCSSAT